MPLCDSSQALGRLTDAAPQPAQISIPPGAFQSLNASTSATASFLAAFPHPNAHEEEVSSALLSPAYILSADDYGWPENLFCNPGTQIDSHTSSSSSQLSSYLRSLNAAVEQTMSPSTSTMTASSSSRPSNTSQTSFEKLNAMPQSPIIISVDDDYDWADSLLFGTGSHDPAKRPIAGTRRVSRFKEKQASCSPTAQKGQSDSAMDIDS
jgi:hypothetical protein